MRNIQNSGKEVREGSIVIIKPLKKNKAYGGKRANEYMCKHSLKLTRISEVIEPDEQDPFRTYHIACDDNGIDTGWFWSRKMFWVIKK